MEDITHLFQTLETVWSPRVLGLGPFSITLIDLLDLVKLSLMDTYWITLAPSFEFHEETSLPNG